MTSAPNETTQPVEPGKLQRERDFYRHLLDLGTRDEIEPFLEGALALIIEISGAQRGYLELLEGPQQATPRFWMAHGCYDEDIEEIRAAFSRGVIAEALATGQMIITESALRDPRFWTRGSVRRNRTEAVLCAPIGGMPPLGVVYLQDRVRPGPFAEEDRQRVETFARHLATFADRLLLRRSRQDEEDPTQPFRKGLKVTGFVGRSPALAQVLKQVSHISGLDVSVLLTGPSGTGKTQLARLIHENSPRSSGPFVPINCATLQETLVENELFGSVPGSHSTATKRTRGKVEQAEGGTLFLDEVAELNPHAQAALLQLLQSGEYYPIGGTELQRANVRIIAATNKDLKDAVASKSFREDLRFRLEVLRVRMPSLAERPEDIRELVEHFCAQACQKHRLPLLRLSLGAVRALEAAEWTGNVRELEHAVLAGVIRAAGEKATQVERAHLFPEDQQEREEARPPTFQEATQRFQKRLVEETLEETDWNITETANLLDLSRQHVHNLITAFGLRRQRR